MGPGVNRESDAVHGARSRKGCPEVAEQKPPDLLVRVRGLERPDAALSPNGCVVCFHTVSEVGELRILSRSFREKRTVTLGEHFRPAREWRA